MQQLPPLLLWLPLPSQQLFSSATAWGAGAEVTGDREGPRTLPRGSERKSHHAVRMGASLWAFCLMFETHFNDMQSVRGVGSRENPTVDAFQMSIFITSDQDMEALHVPFRMWDRVVPGVHVSE